MNRRRSPTHVCLIGEAGIGKTTLLNDALRDAPRALVGGGLRALSWKPLLPLERAVRTSLPREPVAAVEALSEAVGPNGVLAIDDLHWADADTLGMVADLADRCRLALVIRSGDAGTEAAREAVLAAGIQISTVPPLTDQEASRHLRERYPELDSRTVRSIVMRAGGNPLALGQLAITGELDSTLAEALRSRIESCPDALRTALAMLALAHEPLRVTDLGEMAAVITDEDFATDENGYLILRHDVFGAAAIETIDAPERAELHLRLSDLEPSAGARAAHLLAAGRPQDARPLALTAARDAASAAERSLHLEVAARCDPADSASLVAAAEAALEARDPARACLLAEDALDASEPSSAATTVLAEALAATCAAERALLLSEAVGSDAPISHRARIAIVRASVLAWPLWRTADARREADRATELAEASTNKAIRAAAARSRARARLATGDPSWRDGASSSTRCWGELLSGNGDVAASIAAAVAARAPDVSGDLLDSIVDLHRHAACDDASARLRRLCAAAPTEIEREVAEAHLAIALADSGRTGAAADLASAGIERAQTPAGRALLAWALVESELAGGRLTRTQHAASDALRLLEEPFPTDVLVGLAASWAALDTPVESHALPELPSSHWPAFAPARLEWEGLRAKRDGEHDRAREVFALAADGWRPVHARGDLRCRWAAAVAALSMNNEAAVDELRAIEADAGRIGLRPLVARARATLRAAGVRAAPRRGGSFGPLTAREAEVLELVRSGFTTTEMSNVLGVARSTVETQIESAMRRLGAKTRTQAAAMLGALTT